MYERSRATIAAFILYHFKKLSDQNQILTNKNEMLTDKVEQLENLTDDRDFNKRHAMLAFDKAEAFD
jgi:hypothetical protein